jgi:LysR family hydrogen peroxide-inducible transcriptional activator
MDIRPLRYFSVLARELHFQRAARRLHVTQPALSQAVHKLEQELGVRLFERSPRQVTLTAAGARFLPRVLAVLEEVRRSVEALDESGEAPGGTLRVAAIPTLCPYVMPEIILSLRREAPRVVLELDELPTSTLVDKLKQGGLDLGLLSLPIQDRGLACLSLGREPFYLAVGSAHPLARRKSVKVAALGREKIMVLREAHCFSRQALNFCKLSRQDPRVIFQGDSLLSVLRLVAAGEAVTLVPSLARDHSPGLCFLPFSSPGPSREIGLVWRLSTPPGRIQRLFIETVRLVLQKKIHSGGAQNSRETS